MKSERHEPDDSLPDASQLDPTFLHARREAGIIFLVWCVALVWSVSICYWLGYHVDASQLTTVAGVPAWIFWGIATPWSAAVVFSLWFCFAYMVDDDLSGGHLAAVDQAKSNAGHEDSSEAPA